MPLERRFFFLQNHYTLAHKMQYLEFYVQIRSTYAVLLIRWRGRKSFCSGIMLHFKPVQILLPIIQTKM